VTFTIKYQADGFDLSCSDSAIVTVYCSDNDPPIAQLMYPTGGETLSGTETVSWFALDTELLSDLPIRLYYSPAGVNTWMPIGGVLYNNIDESHGSYNWNTNTLSDGSYKLKVVAQDNYYNIAESESKAFTINNDYANARVSSIQITDTSINSDSWVKDGDTIEITAGITGGSRLNRMDITADLSGFGKTSSVVADNYDGYVASWVVADVTCTPSDGPIQVAVTTDGDTNTGMITADNTVPVINLVKPTPGLYLFNTRLFPMSRTVIIGPITIVVDAVDISMAEFYVDVLDGHPEGYVIQAPFSWTMNYKLQGLHTVKIRLIDFAGNMNEQSLDLFIHNARGKPLN
jgi:hypothetical protein